MLTLQAVLGGWVETFPKGARLDAGTVQNTARLRLMRSLIELAKAVAVVRGAGKRGAERTRMLCPWCGRLQGGDTRRVHA